MGEAVKTRTGSADRELPLGLSLSRLWMLVSLLLPGVVVVRLPMPTVDLAYLIRAGEVMLRTSSLLRTDVFTFTIHGQAWLNQQWGSEILFAVLYRAGGWVALAATRGALASGIFFFVYLACHQAGASTKRAAALSLASFGVTLTGLGLRPQLLGMLLFALSAWLLVRRRRSARAVWWIPALVVIWANLHGSFFLAPVLLCLAWLEDRSARVPHAGRLLSVAASSVLAATLNPFGLRIWAYAVSIPTNSQISRSVTEWQPPIVRDITGATFFVSAVLLVAFLARRRTPTPWPSLLSMLVFFIAGLFAVRGVFWWALAIPPVVAKLMEGRTDRDEVESQRRSVVHLSIAAFLVVVLCLSVASWWPDRRAVPPGNDLLQFAPPGVTRVLSETLDPSDRMFNPQIWGSWLEFALPGHPVFVDSRIELFPSEVWRDYFTVSNGQEGWQGVLDRWRVSLVVASREQQRALIPRITRDPGWQLVHQDEDGAVFVRV